METIKSILREKELKTVNKLLEDLRKEEKQMQFDSNNAINTVKKNK